MPNHNKFSIFVNKGTRLLLFVAMLLSLLTSSLAPASVARAQAGSAPVTVTVQDTAAAPLAGRTVYVFDSAGIVYLGVFGVTDGNGQVTFNLPTPGSYIFGSDDVNSVRYFSAACDITACSAATIVEPVFGQVTVTVTDANGPLTGRTVYAFDSSGPTYVNISKVTDGAGQALFDLPAGSYVFGSDDVNNVRYFSTPPCVVVGCTAASIVEPVFGSVSVSVVDTNNAPLVNRVVYAFDGAGVTYQNLFATTDGTGVATFSLPAGNYQFASDDVNSHRYFTGLPACTVPACTAATITEPVFGSVAVTVTDGVNALAGRVVYVFDGSGATYQGISAVTNGSGVATFSLGAAAYTFATDDGNNKRYFSAVCTVTACNASTITLPVFGAVSVTVQDTNGGLLASRIVYVFDGNGVYEGIAGITGPAGEAVNFNLPTGDHVFASDDINNRRYFSAPVCSVPACTTASVVEPLFSTVSVTVLDGALNLVPNQVVYAFDGTGVNYTGLSAVTGPAGEAATFNLPVASYRFAADNGISQRFFSFPSCDLPACTSATVILADVADLGVTKTANPTQATAGGSVTFTIVASNAGPNTAANVLVNDLLPAGLTYASDDSGGAYASGVWTIGSLAAGASATLHITATVGLGANGGPITNTAAISAAQSDLWPANNSASASVNVGISDLCATSGAVTMPDGAVVPIWGYAPGDCSNNPSAQIPGPTLVANTGDTVTITLHNNLPEDTALLFQGQAMVPDFTAIPTGGSRTYSFTASNPGTYLYEAGLLPNTQHQVAMGLYGAVVVYPATSGQAYNSADTAFDNEALLVLGEIDPALNGSANPAAFDMRDFAGKYFLINGKAFPATDPIQSLPGNTVLLRYVNASVQQHSMTVLGLEQRVIAYDGSLLTYSHAMVAETFGPGQTVDVIVSIPASAALGTKVAVYEGNLMLRNSNAPGFGGMLTFIQAGALPGPGGDVLGPLTSGVGISLSQSNGSVPITLSATISDSATGGANVTAAEYFIDSIGANGTGASMNISAPGMTVNADALISTGVLAGLADGTHTVYVHGLDAAGNWGPSNLVSLSLDRTGPVSKILSLTPNPTNGSVGVTLVGTGDDRATGNSDILAAEYFIGATGAPGSGAALTANLQAPIVSLNATFSVASLAPGAYLVSVRSLDALGNWGPFATVSLVIDQTGPVVSNVAASPNPTNGRQGINSSTPAVRLTATLTDSASTIKAAEGFLRTVGPVGTGFWLIPSDGLFNSLSENAYVDIPFSTIAQLPDGSYTLYVRGKDAAGNWGNVGSTVLVINRVAPDVANVVVADAGARVATLTANATSAVANIALAEWFIGADPGQGNAAQARITENGAVARLAADINTATRPNGTYTVYVRAMDAAGNWSNTGSATLTVNNFSSFVPPTPGAIKQFFVPMVSRP